MASPVWVLSVDLQTKTATFQSGMAEAAKSARSAFTEIKSGSTEMGGHVTTNMFASRHAIMAVSEAFGVQVPRAITALLSHIGPLGAALEAAFPFAAIALAAVLLIEKMGEMHAAGIKLSQDQLNFGTAVQTAFNSLDQKLLQSGIKADELRNDHIGALKKQLELIDKQSMAELVETFGKVAKAADTVFTDLKSHWYTFGIGADGAKHAMDDFQSKYDSLIAQGKTGEATDLLKGTRESAERVLALQEQAKKTSGHTGQGREPDNGAFLTHEAALTELKRAGVGFTEKEVQAQQVLVSALQSQVALEGKVSALKKQDQSNATVTTGKELAGLAAEGARQAAEHRQKMGELAVAAEREQATVTLAIHQSNIAARLASDIALADKEYAVQLQGNKDLQGALDRGGKDYQNQLKGLQNKEAELTQQHTNTLAALRGKATLESYQKDLADFEEAEREKIEATDRGSAARLAAIDAAIKAEQSKNLQATQHYRELLTQRAEAVRQAAEEEAKIQSGLGKEEAEQVQRMGELALAAERESWALRDSARRVSIQMRMAEEIEAANKEAALKQTALQHEIQTLDKSDKQYLVKRKELQNKEKQLVQAHANEITAINDKAAIEQNQRVLSAQGRFVDSMSGSLTQLAMGQKSFASTMNAVGEEVVSGLVQNAIKSMLANDMTKESDAAAAARKAYLAGASIPVAGVVLGPLFGAAAFAAVMAFNTGGVVPGSGNGDTVPAMLTPGESVLPKNLTDGLVRAANGGGLGGDTHYHAHVKFAPVIHAIDGDGVERMLDKHSGKFMKHVEKTMRRLNG